MKVLILAGGLGTRLGEETNVKPKPMVGIGGFPILWHIMKIYSHYGFNEFVVLTGYKQEVIKDYFVNYYMNNSDVTVDLATNDVTVHQNSCEPWKVTVVDTGLDTMTGGRIKRVRNYIGNETFMMTYGDGVCDIDISKLVEFHKEHGKLATLTSVILEQQKGVLDIGGDNTVRAFREKKYEDGAKINAGFMVLEPQIIDLIEGDATVFENEPMRTLAERGELKSYSHHGFWQCMDNVNERNRLEGLWQSGKAPWKVW